MRILHHGAISLFHVILEILHIPSPSNIVIIFLWSHRLWCEFFIYYRCIRKFRSCGFFKMLSLKSTKAELIMAPTLWLHFMPENIIAGENFIWPLLKFHNGRNNSKKRIQRHSTIRKARDLVPYGVIWKSNYCIDGSRPKTRFCAETKTFVFRNGDRSPSADTIEDFSVINIIV